MHTDLVSNGSASSCVILIQLCVVASFHLFIFAQGYWSFFVVDKMPRKKPHPVRYIVT